MWKAKQSLILFPADYLSSGNNPGLRGEYYPNMDLSGDPKEIRIDSTVDFIWDGKSPAKGFSVDNYSVRWTGQLTAPKTGKYLLGLNG